MIVRSTAARLATGSAPGCAVQTGQMRVFGSPPGSFGQRQNILLRVESCTWISRPITASHPAGHAHAAPASAGGRVIERERALERVRGREQPVLAERGPGQVEPDRQTLREPARERDRGQAREVDAAA